MAGGAKFSVDAYRPISDVLYYIEPRAQPRLLGSLPTHCANRSQLTDNMAANVFNLGWSEYHCRICAMTATLLALLIANFERISETTCPQSSSFKSGESNYSQTYATVSAA